MHRFWITIHVNRRFKLLISRTRRSLSICSSVLLLGLLAGCASLPGPVERAEEFTVAVTGDSALDQTISDFLAPYPDQSAAHFLKDGLDAFAARLTAADRASRSIDAQYYLFHDDVTGGLYAESLLRAAKRGVKVRLLLDDMGAHRRDEFLLALDHHPNFDIRIFNPFANRKVRALEYLYRFGLVTRRMHNKSMVVDGVAAITGGRNIGDDYFDASPKSNFIDLDVMVFGPAVDQIAGQFDDYWNSPLSYDINNLAKQETTPTEVLSSWQALHDEAVRQSDSVYLKRVEQAAFLEHLREGTLPISIGPAMVLVDQPQKVREPLYDDTTHLAPDLWPYFRQAESELVILNPYFIPSDSGVQVLADAARRGCRVVVLTNSLAANDVAAVHGHYAKYRKPLIKAGVELYELRADREMPEFDETDLAALSDHISLHVKTFVFDRQQTFIGSLNLDARSVYQNTELGVIVEDPKMAGQIAELALNNLSKLAYHVQLDEDGRMTWTGWDRDSQQEIVLYKEPDASFWLKTIAWISRIMPVESQL